MRTLFIGLAASVLCGILAGCNGAGDTESQLKPPPRQAPEANYVGLVEGLVDAYTGEGIDNLKSEAESALEGWEEGDDPALSGPNGETCKQILQGVKDLQTLLGGSPSDADVKKKLDELKALAVKLPGGAEAAAGTESEGTE